MIFSRHSVLKRGCSTWDRQQMPQQEYEGVSKVTSTNGPAKLDALVIYGDNYAYADLCYLTNYFPKVRGGIGIIRSGPISLLLNIGSAMFPSPRVSPGLTMCALQATRARRRRSLKGKRARPSQGRSSGLRQGIPAASTGGAERELATGPVAAQPFDAATDAAA